ALHGALPIFEVRISAAFEQGDLLTDRVGDEGRGNVAALRQFGHRWCAKGRPPVGADLEVIDRGPHQTDLGIGGGAYVVIVLQAACEGEFEFLHAGDGVVWTDERRANLDEGGGDFAVLVG